METITLEYIEEMIQKMNDAPVPPRIPLLVPECYRELFKGNEEGIEFIADEYWRM